MQCVKFLPRTEMEGSKQNSLFVQLIIYLPFQKGLQSSFNINTSKVIFIIYIFHMLYVMCMLYWIAIVNAFEVKNLNCSDHCHESKQFRKIAYSGIVTSAPT